MSEAGKRVLLLGATGTIGRATAAALAARRHDVTCFVRPPRDAKAASIDLPGCEVRYGQITDSASLADDGFRNERFDAVVSCLASRTGAPADAWAIDHAANVAALAAAKAAGSRQFILLSAICVQNPRLAFQHAKLAFEAELMTSGLDWTIVRPTAFFKSLSGQVERVRAGKPFLVFGNGTLTACKPIADEDVADFLADCLTDPSRANRILPVGGPDDAITPLQQGQLLFDLLGRPPRYRHVPVALLDAIVGVLSTLGRISPALAAKAELARIGRYYATESMLVLDPATGRYDASVTPSAGTRTLRDHYAAIIGGQLRADLREHAVFQ